MENRYLAYIREKLSHESSSRDLNSAMQENDNMDFSSCDALRMGEARIIEEHYKRYKEEFHLEDRFISFDKSESEVHGKLIREITAFAGKESSMIYYSGMSVIDCLMGEDDAVIVDELTNISLSGKVRMCTSTKYTYRHNNMKDLESQLMLAQAQRFRIIITDGMFSVDGDLARLDEICSLADRYDALIMVDETYAAGIIGLHGRGCAEHFGISSRINIITGNFDKMFGGIPGGYVAASPEIVEWIRLHLKYEQSISPQNCCLLLSALDYIRDCDADREKLWNNTEYFKQELKHSGFRLKNSGPAVCTVMTYDTRLTKALVSQLENDGITARGFWFPLVPKKQARIRFRMSARFSIKELDRVLYSLIEHGRAAQII